MSTTPAPKPKRVEMNLLYRACLEVSNPQTVRALQDHDNMGMFDKDRLFPECWEIVGSCAGPVCWVEFQCDDPITPEQMKRVTERVQVLDDAWTNIFARP
jgi:hypothetical protein